MATAKTSATQWPSWTMAPTLNFWQGEEKTVRLSRYIKNPKKEPMGYSLAVGSNPLPNNVSFTGDNNEGVTWSGSGAPNGAYPGIKFRVTNLLTGYHTDSPLTTINIGGQIVLPPSTPINVTATATSDSTIRVSWQAGAGGSTISTYRVYRSSAVTGPFQLLATDSASPYDDTTLSAGRTMYYAVSAVDTNGTESSQSLIASAMTFPGPPAMPVNVSAVGISDSTIRVAWTAGVGGPAAVNFRVYRSTTQGGSYSQIATDDASPYDNTSLSGSQTYWYKVSALDASNVESTLSDAVMGTTLAPPVPEVPINLSVEALSPTSARLTWEAALTGAAATGYKVYTSTTVDGDMSVKATLGNVLTYDDTTLSAGETRYYAVSATNANGESTLSPRKYVKTPVPLPPAIPVAVTAVGTSQTNIRVSWTPGSGGTTPANYRIFRSTSQTGPFVFLASDTASPYDDSSVTAGQTFWYTVSASNSNGESQQSTPAMGTSDQVLLPATPTNLTATPLSGTWIRVSWLPGTGGSTITAYRLYSSSTQNGSYSFVAQGPGTTHEDTTLSPGQTKWYKIAATDGTNESAQSTAVGATTPALPATPVNLTATALSTSVIRLAWDAVENATSYKIYRTPDITNIAFTQLATSTVPTYDNIQLPTPGKQYWYRVSAVNAQGEGNQSTSATATTLPAPTTRKWNPGHYMQTARGDFDAVQANRFKYYDQIGSNTSIKGVQVCLRWAALEGATQGNYTAGFAMVDAEIAKLKSLASPKRFFLRMIDRAYNAGSGWTNYFPSYVQPQVVVSLDGVQRVPKLWVSSVMDDYIALINAYGARYDDEPYFEGICLVRETAVGNIDASGYNATDHITQLQRLASAGAAAFPKSMVLMATNFVRSATTQQIDNMMNHCESVKVGLNSPDTAPPPFNTRGIDWLIGASGEGNNAGVVPVGVGIEDPDLGIGTVVANSTVTAIHNYAYNTMKASHFFWNRGAAWTTSPPTGGPSMLAFINTNPPVWTTQPTVY